MVRRGQTKRGTSPPTPPPGRAPALGPLMAGSTDTGGPKGSMLGGVEVGVEEGTTPQGRAPSPLPVLVRGVGGTRLGPEPLLLLLPCLALGLQWEALQRPLTLEGGLLLPKGLETGGGGG